MANKTWRNIHCSLVINEIQITMTVRFHLTLVRMPSSITQTATNAGEYAKGKRNPCHCWWQCKLAQPLWKAVWRFLKKLKIDLAYDLAIPLPGIYPKECKPEYNRDTCTPISIAALFTIAKAWKQPRCPTTDDWIKKMWYLHTTDIIQNIKKNKIILLAGE
jgi:hypothetical protein